MVASTILNTSSERQYGVQYATHLSFTLEAKQGKHLLGHRHYLEKLKKQEYPSILTHPNPQKLVNQFAGTGFTEGTSAPGVAGYKEVIDFGEIIGYAVDLTTKKKTLTTWGKIHYAKDGVHIVPTAPKS